MASATELVWTHSRLNRQSAAFGLLLAIAEHARTDGVPWPGREKLAKWLRIDERSVRRCITAAVEAGELERRHALDGRVVWWLRLPGLDPVDIERLRRLGLELEEPFSPDPRVREADPSVRPPGPRRPRTGPAGPPPLRKELEVEVQGELEERVSDGSAPKGAPTAKALVAFYVKECRRRGAEPLPSVVGQVGRELKARIAESATERELRDALSVLIAKGLHPSTLGSEINARRLRHVAGTEEEDLAAYDA